MTWSASSDYSGDELVRMQQDAIKRVQEMQERASKTLERANRSSASFAAPHFAQTANYPSSNNAEDNKNDENTYINPPLSSNEKRINSVIDSLEEQESASGKSGILTEALESLLNFPQTIKSLPLLGDGEKSVSSIMETLGLTTEKLLLIGLIFILSNDGADKTLLLALGYLLF